MKKKNMKKNENDQEEETSAVSNISGHTWIKCAMPCVSFYDFILCSAAKKHPFVFPLCYRYQHFASAALSNIFTIGNNNACLAILASINNEHFQNWWMNLSMQLLFPMLILNNNKIEINFFGSSIVPLCSKLRYN